jgi:hypothetical protein
LGKGNKVDTNKEQSASLAAVRSPSAGEQYLTNEATSLLDTIKAGDYTKRPKNVFFNFADPAQRAAQREMMFNAGGQGTFALGAPDPNLLALNKQNLDDEYARDTAGQYEQDWSNAGLRAAGMLGDVASLENQREGSALGATTSMWNTRDSRPRWYETLFSGARSAAAAGAGAGGYG